MFTPNANMHSGEQIRATVKCPVCIWRNKNKHICLPNIRNTAVCAMPNDDPLAVQVQSDIATLYIQTETSLYFGFHLTWRSLHII